MNAFSPNFLAHASGSPAPGDAAQRVISPADVEAAWSEITRWDGYAPTPLLSLTALADEVDVGAIHYKDEGPRFGLGSFKALGGAYAAQRLLQQQIHQRTGQNPSLFSIAAGQCRSECAEVTLVSATDGNHGRSLAWGCQRFGAPCRIYVHAEVSDARINAMRNFGADVIRIDGDYDASVAMARDEAEANDWFVVSDTSWPGYVNPPRDVMAGYGVMAREIFDDVSAPPTHVFLQGGVGGFAGAIAAVLRQHWGDRTPRVIIVEPDRAACLFESARAGRLTSVAISEETIMAGLSCGEPSPLAWDILQQEASDFLTVPDSMVPAAMRLLARPLGSDPEIEAGESAVAGVAALIAARESEDLSAKLGLDSSSRVLLFGTEGITDPDIYARIMDGADEF